ncbi:MAG: DNA polymerase/3'-5' exonuclease PolX [Candidatus Micrarchaeia archaeon]
MGRLIMYNKDLEKLFNEIALMLSLEETATSKFEIRAYQKAAFTIGTLQEPIEDIYKRGGIKALMELPGIGKTIAMHIEEYIKTGKIKKYEDLKKKYPINMSELTSLTGMGAKKAIILYKKLGIKNIEDLKKAIEEHKIEKLERFGKRSEDLIKRGIEIYEKSKGRMLLGDALPIADNIVEKLSSSGLIDKIMIAGSTRRMRETVGDLDILAISSKQNEVMDFFVSLDDVDRVISKGPTKTTVWLKEGLSCDLRVLEPESFGAAVQYFTGSKEHNIELRQIAISKGYKLNEYGLFDKKGRNVGGSDEKSIYEQLGLQYIPPEMREGRGELELAKEHRIPKLVELSDIHGDLHTHTKETDGANTIEEMVAEAKKLNYEYIAITNHTKSLKVAHGMNDKQFEEFFARIDNIDFEGIKVLKGAEVDILEDGRLDLKDKTLEDMDCVVAGVHSKLSLSEEAMTKRIIDAFETGLVNIFAHPTGRLIGTREPYKVNIEKIAEAAEKNNVVLEINSFPNRLDLNDSNILLLSKYNLKFSIDTDSHRTTHLYYMRLGVGMARRGWLTKEKIINTLEYKQLMKILKK